MGLPPLKVRIGADNSELDAALNRSQSSMKRFAAASAAAVAAVGVALFAMTRRSMQNIDALTKQARSLGLTTKALQAMSLVAQEAGVSTDRLTQSLGLMQRQIVELERGSASATRAFDALGLKLRDLQRLSPDEQFRKIADALNRIEDPALRTATAMEIFGRSGRDVINMLDNYGSKIDEAREFQDRFNISVSEIDARNIEEANDAAGRLREAIGGLGNTLSARFAPDVKIASNALLSLVGVLVDRATPAETAFWKETDRVSASAKGAKGNVANLEGAFDKVGGAATRTAEEISKANAEIAEFFRLAKEGKFLSEEEIADLVVGTGWERASERLARLRADLSSLVADPSVRLHDVVVRDAEPGTPRPRMRGVDDFPDITTVPGLGGGSSVRELMRDRLDALMEGLMTEREVVQAWYSESMQLLVDARQQGLLTEQEFMDQRERLEEEHQRRLAEIREAYESRGMASAKGFFQGMAAIAQAGGQRMAKVAATIGAVQGVIDAYGAALKALNSPEPLTVGQRFAAYAGVLAAGLKGVAAIQQAGRVGGAAGGSQAGAAQAQAGPTQLFNIRFQGDTISTDTARSGLRQLFEMIEDGQRQGFQIRATVA